MCPFTHTATGMDFYCTPGVHVSARVQLPSSDHVITGLLRGQDGRSKGDSLLHPLLEITLQLEGTKPTTEVSGKMSTQLYNMKHLGGEWSGASWPKSGKCVQYPSPPLPSFGHSIMSSPVCFPLLGPSFPSTWRGRGLHTP